MSYSVSATSDSYLKVSIFSAHKSYDYDAVHFLVSLTVYHQHTVMTNDIHTYFSVSLRHKQKVLEADSLLTLIHLK